MPAIQQLISGVIIFVILLVLLWLAFYVFVIALAIGLVVGAYVFIKRLLIEKGILNNRDAGAPESQDDIDVIEVEYHEVDDEPRR